MMVNKQTADKARVELQHALAALGDYHGEQWGGPVIEHWRQCTGRLRARDGLAWVAMVHSTDTVRNLCLVGHDHKLAAARVLAPVILGILLGELAEP